MAWLGLNPDAGLAGLALASLLSATLLPGGSEVLLFGYLHLHPSESLAAIFVCTLGNTLGGLITWWCGRALPEGALSSRIPHRDKVQHWGSPILLLSWVPVIGDAFCLAAWWLRLHWLPCLVFMAIGKGLRYYIVTLGVATPT